MDAMQEMLYKELRLAEQEVLQSLRKKNRDHQLKEIFEEELDDLRSALKKLENGNFGLCEISGESIPVELLRSMPTLKSINDISDLGAYCKKPFYTYC